MVLTLPTHVENIKLYNLVITIYKKFTYITSHGLQDWKFANKAKGYIHVFLVQTLT
jgi:hypothetical protein